MLFNFFHKKRTVFGLTEKDLYHHAVLALVLLAGLFLFAYVSYSRMMQFSVGVLTSVAYVIWGFMHHKLEGDFHYQNMIEYVFIALLAIVILGGIYL